MGNLTYFEKLDALELENKELKSELESYKRCNNNLLRIFKERENAKRGLYPKKEHTGYCVIQSTPIDYKYYLHGSHKKVELYQSVFQTPYNVEFDYYDVFNLVDNDLCKDDCYILKELGFKNYDTIKRYEELVDNEIAQLIKEKYDELKEEYKKVNHREASWDDLDELRKQAEEEDLCYFFNMNVRSNFKDGYWEMIIQSTSPLPVIPKDLRFRKGDKDGAKDKNV